MPEVMTGTPPPTAAPAAKPVAPVAAPPPTAKPPGQTGASVSKPANNIDDAYSQLDKLAADPPADPKAKPEPKAPDALDASDTPPKDDQTPPPEPKDTKPVKAGTLRENYDRLKGEFSTLQTKLKTLETERAQPQDPKEHPEFKKVTETLTAREKRLQELEEELRFSNYERSTEYKDTYEKPFVDAYSNARNKVAALKVTNSEGLERQGQAQDFDAIMRIQDDGEAAQTAFDLFGNKASIVMYHREKVQELNNSRTTALEDYRKQGAERDQQRQTERETSQKKMVTEATETWKQSVAEPYEKYPHYFKPVEGDTKGNELLQAGFEEAARAFKIMNVLDSKLTPEQRQAAIKDHAVVFNKAATWNRLAYQLSAEKKLRQAAETKLKEYENSEPGSGDANGKKTDHMTTQQKVDADLMKYVR